MFGKDAKVEPLSTETVLQREFAEIWGDFPTPSSLKSYYMAAHVKEQAALCLSGGGIRSAAFGLGVLEALAKKDLLTKFHYLSTVSGGGYIGGFLTRWIHEKEGDAAAVQSVLKVAATPGAPEPAPTQWLREYSNFLTPRTGLASADTWTAAVLWIRNTLINWFVFLPFFLVAVSFPNLYLAILRAIPPGAAGPLLALCLVLITFATYSTCRDLPSHAAAPISSKQVFWRVASPSLLASLLLPAALAPALVSGSSISILGFSFGGHAFVFAGLGMTLGLITGYALAWERTHDATFTRNPHVWAFGAVVSGAAVGLGAHLAELPDCHSSLAQTPSACDWHNSLYASLAPLAVVISQLLLTIFYTAFRQLPSKKDPKLSPDLDREWLARLSAVKLRFAVVVAVFTGLVLVGPLLFFKYLHDLGPWLLGVLGSSSGLAAVFGGKAEKTGSAEPAGWGKALTFNRIVLLATLVFIALLTILLSWGEKSLAGFFISAVANDTPGLAAMLGHIFIVVAAAVVLWVTSTYVDVNRFSLNAVYSNRLCRAFLGAVRKRESDQFTNFDPTDNVRMGKLRYTPPSTADGPKRVLFPVVNLALNLVGGDRLAWQERKAHSFTVTPLACGSAVLGAPDAIGEISGSYVGTEEYAGSERDGRMRGKGITLATAMAISGAAASPNMGYNSAPATAFLMTLFNVRLGAWLPNPGYEHTAEDMQKSGPSNALRPFLSELTGQTNGRSQNIYLSDGGHFENLGLYEMIRRRCRYIVVSDAGHDPDAKFEDLGNAVRKIMADLDGVAITFSELQLRSRENQLDPPVTFALGDIDYGNGQEGKILYVKPSYFTSKPANFTNELSVDIRSYANLHDEFPHESTADQWFSESQFESYRRLGETLVSTLGKNASYATIQAFFDALKPPAIADAAIADSQGRDAVAPTEA
jgi:hypothetical protein